MTHRVLVAAVWRPKATKATFRHIAATAVFGLMTATTSLWLMTAGASFASPQQHDRQHKPASSSQHHSANEYMNRVGFEGLVDRFERPERLEWQKPDLLLDRLGDLNGKTVADIGSGTGYLAFRMAERGAQVLCVDVDERFLAYILGKRDALGMDEEISLRLSPYDRPSLEEDSVDLVVTVNTYHHIEKRTPYFRVVREALVNGGRLVVVDFKEGNLPEGPPPEMKISPSRIESELRDAGFTTFSLDQDTLPLQFILTAS